MTYPPELAIVPLAAPPNGTVSVPGSKSITTGALVLAILGTRSLRFSLRGCLKSEDSEVMLDCLEKLGFGIITEWNSEPPVVHISGGEPPPLFPNASAGLFVRNSGTTIRFLTAALTLGRGSYRLDGVLRMRERPIQDLVDGLNRLGANVECQFGNGCPPVIVNARGLQGGRVKVKADVSSQYLSGMMLAC